MIERLIERIILLKGSDEELIKKGVQVPKESGEWYFFKIISPKENEEIIGKPRRTFNGLKDSIRSFVEFLPSYYKEKHEIPQLEIENIKNEIDKIKEDLIDIKKSEKIQITAQVITALAASASAGAIIYQTIKEKEGKSRQKRILTNNELKLSIKTTIKRKSKYYALIRNEFKENGYSNIHIQKRKTERVLIPQALLYKKPKKITIIADDFAEFVICKGGKACDEYEVHFGITKHQAISELEGYIMREIPKKVKICTFYSGKDEISNTVKITCPSDWFYPSIINI